MSNDNARSVVLIDEDGGRTEVDLDWLSPRELLNAGKSADARAAEQGLRSVRIGRRRLVPASEIERFIARQLDQPADPTPAA